MFFDLQLLCLGAAATIDSALLIGLLERRNLRNLPVPVVALLAGTWLFHCGEFANLLLTEAAGSWAEFGRCLAMSCMAAGLLLMPCSLLHAVVRLWGSGFQFEFSKGNRTYFVLYAPMILLPVAIYELVAHLGIPFLNRVPRFVVPYTYFTGLVNVLAITTFLRQLGAEQVRETKRFLAAMVFFLVSITVLLIYVVRSGLTNVPDSPLVLLVIMSPLGPTLLFSYFVVRYRFMHLVLERTIVYGTFLAAVLLFHRLFVQSVTERLQDRFRIDFGIVEGAVILLLMVLYPPSRRRVKEALRYLLGRDVTDLRARTRQLAVEMWQHVQDEPQVLLHWFLAEIRRSFDIRLAALWLFDAQRSAILYAGDAREVEESQALLLHGFLKSHAFVSADGGGISNSAAVELLQRMQGSLAVRIDQEGVSGLLLLGRHSRGRDFIEEEISAILLLAELLGVTLQNHYLQEQQLATERIAAQNEKMATLGMLASCLTHEIKNPLSSIKTIAKVMQEGFGEEHPQAEDVRLILSEVERLSTTTNQFLKFARPSPAGNVSSSMHMVIDSAVEVLKSLTKTKEVQIEITCEPNLPDVAADENTVRSIVFNLLLNSIEAVHRGGLIRVSACRNGSFVVATVCDDGPGIAPEIHDQLFAPFVTNKPAGTGLGLYIVRRSVEQIGGQIACASCPGEETRFTVKLPFAPR